MGGSSGKEDGESKTYQASHLDAQTVTLNSQGDTNLLGSQIKGNTVNANVGGKLNIESLQDEERFKTKSSGGPTNSKLATNKLTFEDIQNESSSSVASASISGSIKESKEKWVDNEIGSAVKPNTENSTKLDNQRSGGISPGLPMFERDADLNRIGD